MQLQECKNLIINNLSLVKKESEEYANIILEEINSFKTSSEYNNFTHFLSDYLSSESRNYFTVTSKDTFSNFENAKEGYTFVYTPLNDHSRCYMHKGDVVFCYRIGQFDSLESALNSRGIYAIGFVLSDPKEIYADKQKHERWGVAITLPIIMKQHLELRNIQLHPQTINLTPYNGNRNDALQYIEKSIHSNTLLSLIATRNPEIRESLNTILKTTIDNIILPDNLWYTEQFNSPENIKKQFKYFLESCCKSQSKGNGGFHLGNTAVDSIIVYLEKDKLFGYDINRWKHIDSMYNITDNIEVEKIFNELINDEKFINYDKELKNWPSNSIMYYTCFINARCNLSRVLIEKIVKEENKASFPVTSVLSSLPLQQITYGAPGTGKSHGTDGEIKKIYPTKEEEKGKVFRTTFHPDSDYSTFVGCYKPTKVCDKIYSADELHQLFVKESTIFPNRPEHRFAAKYSKSFVKLTIKEAESVFNGVSTTATIAAETPKLMASVEEYSKQTNNNNAITYDYIAQNFTKAYIAAWKEWLNDSKKPIFLVIEEINRGNCAQIFGDLFQLLDREDNGFSSYPIKPDTDLGNHIAEALNGYSNDEFASIINGEELLLPPNLHIWATMNTSDQSLFPIDSAFKRRWDWKYVPIDEGKENWAIDVNGTLYSWSSFLRIINDKIYTKTNSEDKQLGFYFCKAKDGIISADKFVSKVLFYIYNDIYKDYGFDDSFFNDDDNTKLSFRKYYDRTGNVNEVKVEKFLKNLGVEVVKDIEGGDDEEEDEVVDEDGNNSNSSSRDYSKFAINGNGSYRKGNVVYEAVKIYAANNPSKNAEEIVNEWLTLGVNVYGFVETEEMFMTRKQNSNDNFLERRRNVLSLSNGEKIYVSNQYNPIRITEAITKINAANWNINISKV